MEAKNYVAVLIFVFAVLTLVPTTIGADSEDREVNVSVQSETKIDVTTDEDPLEWEGVKPGDSGDDIGIQVENTGSNNITKMYLDTTQPTDRPFGTGMKGEYDAANFLTIKKRGDSKHYFIDRMEFNEVNDLIYVVDRDENTGESISSDYPYGRFRNASKEYFWMVDKTGGTTCDDLSLFVGNNPHIPDQDQRGTVNFSVQDPTKDSNNFTAYSSIDQVGGGENCYADIEFGLDNEEYGVIINNATLDSSQPEVKLAKYNTDLFSSVSSKNMEHFFSGDKLTPGDSIIGNVSVRVPNGVANGEVSKGTLTITAES